MLANRNKEDSTKLDQNESSSSQAVYPIFKSPKETENTSKVPPPLPPLPKSRIFGEHEKQHERKKPDLQNVDNLPSRGSSESRPNQSCLKEYPSTHFGKRTRSFLGSWYEDYPWLEYNVEKDAAFCYPC